MHIRPVSEAEANPQTQKIYQSIKEALQLPHVPLFFQFLGGFPEYLEYIGSEIIANLEDPRFSAVIQTRNNFVSEIFHEDFDRGKEIADFLTRYKNTPEFYYFEKDVQSLFAVNAKLAFIFISLREAVKGWAVAARKLPSAIYGESKVTSQESEMEEELVYGIQEGIKNYDLRFKNEEVTIPKSYLLNPKSKTLATKSEGQIAVALLPEYLKLCRNEFAQLIKTQQFLFLRVELEKVVLRSIDTLPHKIESPINVVLELTKMYPMFPDLLYLLSEHFPTYAMQRWLFSAFLLP